MKISHPAENVPLESMIPLQYENEQNIMDLYLLDDDDELELLLDDDDELDELEELMEDENQSFISSLH